MKLENMICVVTGASGCTGSAIASELSNECSAVVGVVRGLSKGSFSGEVEWRDFGNHKYEATADVVNQTSVGFLVSEVLRHLDIFHVWVNVVGGFTMGKVIEETVSEDWPKMFDINFISVLNCCKKIFPIFKAQRFGRIINFGSIAGIDGMALAAPYAVSKAAVINLTKTIALEGRDYNITANVIVPNIIDTPANRKTMPKADFSTWTKPEIIAKEIVSIISTERTAEVVRV